MTDFDFLVISRLHPKYFGHNEEMTEIASGVFVPQNPSQGRGSEFKGEGDGWAARRPTISLPRNHENIVFASRPIGGESIHII